MTSWWKKPSTQVRREKLDLIALAGDFADTETGRVESAAGAPAENCRPRHGVFAVMGNHDGWNAGTRHRPGGISKKPAFPS